VPARLITHLLENNRRWAAKLSGDQPGYFDRLAAQQNPDYLWIGCSDSRVPANEIVGLLPGELFVHRNVANVVVHTDLTCLSVLQYAVDVLKVKHIIVTGHYGCGGVRAALDGMRLGLIDNWLRHVQDVHATHRAFVDRLSGDHQFDRLCELNVIEQARHVCETTIVQDAWARLQPVAVHAWVYSLRDGIIRPVEFAANSPETTAAAYPKAVASVMARR
jgi:carbonic anhydrase